MHGTNKPLTLGQQLREARLRARLKPKDLARKAKVGVASVYVLPMIAHYYQPPERPAAAMIAASAPRRCT